MIASRLWAITAAEARYTYIADVTMPEGNSVVSQ